MRITLIAFLFFLCSLHSFAQNYFPFPTDSAKWKVRYNSSASQCLYLLAEFQYIMNGDTIIGSNTYKKIYKTGVAYDQGCYITSWGYDGAIREDSNKHIFLRWTNSDTLLYDFNLNVGDTVKGYLANNCYAIVVDSIDSVLVQTSFRKRFNCSTHNASFCFSNISIIEGIGGTQGLLCPMGGAESRFVLDCFALNGQTIYPDTITSCPLIVAGMQNEIDKICSVNYLYALNFSSIEFNSDNEPFCSYTGLIIYNELGQLINQSSNENLFPLRLSSDKLGTGLFFARFTNESGQTTIVKFILN